MYSPDTRSENVIGGLSTLRTLGAYLRREASKCTLNVLVHGIGKHGGWPTPILMAMLALLPSRSRTVRPAGRTTLVARLYDLSEENVAAIFEGDSTFLDQ